MALWSSREAVSYHENIGSKILNSFFSAVNDTNNLTSTSFNSATPTSMTSLRRQEVGVAEAWNNQRKRRENSERGNDYII